MCILSDHFNTALNPLCIILACKFMTTMCAVTMQLSEIVKPHVHGLCMFLVSDVRLTNGDGRNVV